MHRSRLPALIVPLALALAACSSPGPGGGTDGPRGSTGPAATKVPAESVAEELMVAVRDREIIEAWDIVSTGDAAEGYNGMADFTAKMIAAGTPESWEFEPLRHGSDDIGSFVILEGPVTFADGATGRVTIEMSALGLQVNPWRVDVFELEKD